MFMPACIHSAVETIGGRGGTSPQIFADQLTLSQPGGQLMHVTLLLSHPTPDFQTFLRHCIHSGGIYIISDPLNYA